MEAGIHILYQIASHSIVVLVLGIFSSIIVGGLYRRVAGQGRVVAAIFFVGFMACLALSCFALANLVQPHMIDGGLIYKYGDKATAKVISRERTNNLHNEEPVDRYNVVYRTQDGRVIETYFESWDFNIYPSANSVRYPEPGQEFSVAYLREYPNAFLILTEEKSEYSNSAKCDQIMHDISEKKNKYDFEPENPRFVGEYMEALSKGIESKCGGDLMEQLRQIGARTNRK